MCRNPAAKIAQDESFLVAFYDNAVNDAGHALNREDPACPELFEHSELVRNMPTVANIPENA